MPEKQLGMVSVVVVSYHTGPVLWRCIESILAQDNLCELIIVDNGNPKKEQHRLGKLAAAHEKVTYLSGHGNIGFAKACNKGVDKASGQYSLLLNPDCVLPTPTILSQLVDAFAKDEEAWMASCRLLNADYTEQPTCRRNLLTPVTALVESFSLHRFLPKRWAEKYRLNSYPLTNTSAPSYVPAISGALMLLKTGRYKEIGGIDEGYFLHVEDMDLCLTIKEKGGKILYIPDVEVVHVHSTSQASSWFVERQKTKGFIRYFKKNFKDAYEPGILPLLYGAIYLRAGIKATLTILRSLHKKPKNIRERQAKKILQHHNKPEFIDAARAITPLLEASSPILITGATSQIGLCLIRRLLAADISVYAQYRSTIIDFYHTRLSWKYACLTTAEPFRPGCFDRGAPETIIHTAPLWLLVDQLPQLADLGIRRVIAFSSTSIFGKEGTKNTKEKAVIERLKQAEEKIELRCTELGISYTILRPTMIYGVDMDENVTRIARFIQKFGFFPVSSPAEGLRSPVHVDDLALATLSLLALPELPNKTYNVTGGEVISYYTMVERIFINLGKKPRILCLKSLLPLLQVIKLLTLGRYDYTDMAQRMHKDLVFDSKAAEEDFGYMPRAFLAAKENTNLEQGDNSLDE